MIQLYLYSFVFIALALFPLWLDAKSRPEYGTRPKFLLASIIVFLSIGILTSGLYLSGALATKYFIYWIFTLLSLYPFVFLLVEYSIHLQRIRKNLLENEFNARLRKGMMLVVSLVVLCALFWGSDLISGNQTGFANKILIILVNTIGFLLFAAIVAFNLSGLILFDLEEGIIRLKKYLFVAGAVITSLMLILATFANFVSDFPLRWVIYTLGILLNGFFAARVYHEYFMHRMQHLNANYNQNRQQDIARISLINKVLVSTPEEDVVIIRDTMIDYLKRLQEAVANPNLRCKSMMLFRRNGNILSVDSKELIIDYCLPLINQESLKRMKIDMAQEHIMTQIFDLDKLTRMENPDTLDFASAAIYKMMKTKEPVKIDPVPQYMAMIFRTILLYPVFNQGVLNAMIVVFKDTSDYLFPQEKVIITDMVSSLAISTTLIDGKRMQEDKNRLHQEMDVAKQIQVSILPQSIELDGYDIASQMITATEVGGDLYDFIQTPFGNYFDIGDVAGHGLPAGMMAVIHMAALHGALGASETLGKQLATTQLYNIINQVLVSINRDRIGSDKFMTCNIISEKDGAFKYAGSHMIALAYRSASDSVEEIAGMIDRAAFLGLSEYADATNSLGEFSLAKDDVLILYTDGLTEARDRFDAFFGLENLSLSLKQNAKRSSLEIKNAVLGALGVFAENGDLLKYGGSYADDVSLLVIKRK